jgi:hypothetical protein
LPFRGRSVDLMPARRAAIGERIADDNFDENGKARAPLRRREA